MNIFKYFKKNVKVFETGFFIGKIFTAQKYKKIIIEKDRDFFKKIQDRDKKIKELEAHINKINSSIGGYSQALEETCKILEEGQRSALTQIHELIEQQQPILKHVGTLKSLYLKIERKNQKTKKIIEKKLY